MAANGLERPKVPIDIAAHVAVFPYGTAEYENAKSAFPNFSSAWSALAAVLPYSVIVKNVSTSPLRGINVVFYFETNDGSMTRNSFLTWNMDPRAMPTLAGGEYLLYFPESILTRVAQEGVPLSDLPPELYSRALSRDFEKYSRVTLAVDSIILSDGRFIGPDNLGKLSAIQDQQRAIRDLGGILQSGVAEPDGRIRASVSALAEMETGPLSPDKYSSRMSHDARVIVRLFEAGAIKAAEDYVAASVRMIQVVRE